jgi:hypothetical protein
MEKLFYNLSEEDLTKERKVLLWVFTVLFFIGGLYVLLASSVFGHKTISPVLSLAPFFIFLVIGSTALFATIKRKDMFFLIDDEKVEFRYGIFKPKRYSFPWSTMKMIVLPHKERKAKIMFKEGTSFIIDLSYLQRKKSTIIRKHLFHAARRKNIDVLKVIHLSHHKNHH